MACSSVASNISSLTAPDDETSDDDVIFPFNNPVILSRLFELSSRKDLATYRLVSKFWYNLSLVQWRSSVELMFWGEALYTNSEFFWVDSGHEQDSMPTVLKFVNFVKDPRNDCVVKPYRKYLLKEWNFKSVDDTITKFWKECGPSIILLNLSECIFESLDVFLTTIFKCAPNMESLTIKDCKYQFGAPKPVPLEGHQYQYTKPTYGEHLKLTCLDIYMSSEHIPVTWLELLSHFPKIDTLRLYNADVAEYCLEMLLTAIGIIRDYDKRKLLIKHLDILSANLYAQEEVSADVCQALVELKLPLENLILDFGINTKDRVVHDILFAHAKTLKKLDVYRGPISKPFQRFPFGINLNNITFMNMSDRLTGNLHFLKYTPNLRTLWIGDVVDVGPALVTTTIVANTNLEAMEGVRAENVKELQFDYIYSTNDMTNLVKWLPNIQKLKTPLDNDKFRILCQNWTGMLELVLLGNELNDFGITGREWGSDEPVGDIPPNITNLIDLRSFQMQNNFTLPTQLMDGSAIHGFLKLPHLQSLKITSQMSDESKNALYAKIPTCFVVRLGEEQDFDHWD